jgi:ATP-dependent RNA helicase DeaD
MVFEQLSSTLQSAIKKKGITTPTEIQEKAIPLIMEGKDVIGESATGSGKTLAFGAGIVEHSTKGQGIQALVLTPTRELAEQVCVAIRSFSKLKIATVYGGVSINNQFTELRTADVVVATPGRLLDHLNRGSVDLSHVNQVVLDEADHMLDMGFIDDVEKIIRACPRDRQTMFFSATMPPRIQSLAKRYMNNPEKVSATKMVDPSKLEQVYYDVNEKEKISLLVHLLKDEESNLTMVFCNTRKSTDFVAQSLKANGINATAIHGGFTQNKRSHTLKTFNSAKTEVMVCTDVAGRGLHIDNVSHVYNFDLPNDPRDYVHRIGRTARAGDDGIVMNLLSPRDHDSFSRILREYREFYIERARTPKVERVKIVKPEAPQRRSGGFRSGGRPSGRSSRGPRSFGPRSNDRPRSSDRPRSNDGSRSSDRPRSNDRPRLHDRPRAATRTQGPRRPRSEGSTGPRRSHNDQKPRGRFTRNNRRD